MFAPILPHVTDEIYRTLFAGSGSIHRAAWLEADATLEDEASEAAGEAMLEIVAAVRRYKSERNLSVGAALARLHLAVRDPALGPSLHEAAVDLRCVTRAGHLDFVEELAAGLDEIPAGGSVGIAVAR